MRHPPAALFGSDSVEHLDGDGSAGRGYCAKASALDNVYEDVIKTLVTSQMTITPTISLFTPAEEFVGADARNDLRWPAQPSWMRTPVEDATVVPAELLWERADLGSIEVGKLADMVVVEGDPLVDASRSVESRSR